MVEFGKCSLESAVNNPISMSVTLIRIPSAPKVLFNVGGVWVVMGQVKEGRGGELCHACVSGCGCHWGLVQRWERGSLTLPSTHGAAGVSKVGE